MVKTSSAPPPIRRWLAHLVTALFLAAFVAALYRLLLFTNRALATGDILLYFYPYRDYASASLRAGQLPLWNPYLFLGAPFLANPQAAVLYPLHWPLSWLDVTRQIYWSAAIHTWLLGLGGYVLLRRWGYSVWAGLAAGGVLAGSGFFGGLIGHINQMNASAWLPWAMALLPMRSTDSVSRRETLGRTLICISVLGMLTALMLLAGHTQSAFISLFALGVWAVVQSFYMQQPKHHRSALVDLVHQASTTADVAAPDVDSSRRSWLRRICFWPQPLIVYVGGVILGALLSAAQLLPTLELSQLGLRSGGLSYLDATSFSLHPLKLIWTLLPSYGLVDLEAIFDTPAFSEFIAYVGVIGVALGLFGAWKGSGVARRFGILFTLLGLFLALGRWNPFYYLAYEFIPGFDLFRTPARWLMLYTLGMAALAGAAIERLTSRRAREIRVVPRTTDVAVGDWKTSTSLQWIVRPLSGSWVLPTVLLALLGVELLLAAPALPASHPTAPQAVNELRTAPAHLRTDPARTALHPAAAGRFLGMSSITYDPGDMADLHRIYREGDPSQLSEREFNDLVIALKVQELLVPNLPLLWRIPAVDGYDGGVLPLLRYNQLISLFAPQQELTPDGRLREQLAEIPSTSLLGLLHVTHVVTDKVKDLWFDGVFYDRQIGARLTKEAPTVVVETPGTFAATHVDVIGAVKGDPETLATLKGRTIPAASMRVQTEAGPQEIQLTAGGAPGAHFADDALDSDLAISSGTASAFRDLEAGRQEYRARLPLSGLTTPQKIEFILSDAPFDVLIQAVTLYDETTGMFLPLLPSDRGRFRLAHSGDVKVYENLDEPPRAFLVGKTLTAADPQQAIELLRTVADPREIAVVEGMTPLDGQMGSMSNATITAYAPERVEVQTQSTEEALLVLNDAFYPGWRAQVDGAPTEIFPTNVLFRGVRIPSGEHTVTFTFEPYTWWVGSAVSIAALGLWLALIAVGAAGVLPSCWRQYGREVGGGATLFCRTT
jgi:hypothetical protein